jgi:hypothetical protein
MVKWLGLQVMLRSGVFLGQSGKQMLKLLKRGMRCPFFSAWQSVLTSVIFVVALTQSASACYSPILSERFANFCVAEQLDLRKLSPNELVIVDYRLKREGYSRGLGFPSSVEQTSVQTFASPILDYNTNINGGNPNRPLVLGGLTFDGDPENFRKSGVIAGASLGVSGRHIYGDGRYLDFGISASYAHSPDHKIGIARTTANVCSRNDIGSQWYVDACGDSARLVRDLSAETTSGLTLSATKLFTTNGSAFHSANVGVRRHFAEEYDHKQLLMGVTTARKNGIYTSLNLALGEGVENQLVLRRGVQATVGANLFNKPVTATFGYSHSDGGKLFGFERSDTSTSINISYAVSPTVSVNIGYKQTKSTIDYFNENEPTVSVQLAPIRF